MDAQDRLHGRLEDVHFPDLLLEISQRRETGIFQLTRHSIEKDIYFQDGRIVFAKSNDPDQRLGELLLRRGKVTLRQLIDCANKIVPGVRLGTILVQEGYLKAGELYQGVIDQVEEIVYSVFEWSEGHYEFKPGELPSKEVITLSISTPDIINMGIARIWRWSWIRKGVGELDTMYLRRKEWNSIAKKMLITPAVQATLEMLEQPMKLEDILRASRINSYETCKIVWALLSIGLIEKLPRMDMPPEISESEEALISETPPERRVEAQPTEIIPWNPRKLPPVPTRTEKIEVEDVAIPEKPAVVQQPVPTPTPTPAPVETEPETGAAPTVEISFSDLAEFTDKTAEPPANEPARPAEIPEQLLRKDISNFNEAHRYLFEMLRIEMGAGVGNFLTKILKKATDKNPLIFEGVRMNEYGELDSEALKANIQGNLFDDYAKVFDWLVGEERATASAFLDKKRIEAIDSGMQKLQEKQREDH